MTDEHLKLLRRAYVSWENCEFGAPSIDCKRPYGNSDVITDICEILGWKIPQTMPGAACMEGHASKIHEETETALEIILKFAGVAVEPYYKMALERLIGCCAILRAMVPHKDVGDAAKLYYQHLLFCGIGPRKEPDVIIKVEEIAAASMGEFIEGNA